MGQSVPIAGWVASGPEDRLIIRRAADAGLGEGCNPLFVIGGVCHLKRRGARLGLTNRIAKPLAKINFIRPSAECWVCENILSPHGPPSGFAACSRGVGAEGLESPPTADLEGLRGWGVLSHFLRRFSRESCSRSSRKSLSSDRIRKSLGSGSSSKSILKAASAIK